MTARNTDSKTVFTCYSLYGKMLKSRFRLPLPAIPDQPADIVIEIGRRLPKTLNHCPISTGREWLIRSDHHIIRFYDRDGHVFEFLLTENGTRITVSQTWPVWQDSVFALVNMVMGAALSLQGRSMLHACSLVYNGRSFLIMGASGAGKSSLSLALAAEGLAAHADDVAVIHNIHFGQKSGEPRPHPPESVKAGVGPPPLATGSHPVIAAGYPRIKVRPELLDTLGVTGVTPIMITSVESPGKERWIDTGQLPGGTHTEPAPLGGLFILRKRGNPDLNNPVVRRLDAMPAALALTQHVYGSAWFNPPGPRNLFLCTDIAAKVPVYEVTMPDNLKRLRDSARLLLADYIRPEPPPAIEQLQSDAGSKEPCTPPTGSHTVSSVKS